MGLRVKSGNSDDLGGGVFIVGLGTLHVKLMLTFHLMTLGFIPRQHKQKNSLRTLQF